MAKNSGSGKRPIEQYEHSDKERLNNPPAGLVSKDTDPESGKKTYQYDPHIDPALQFDSQRAEIENLIDQGLAADDLDEAKAALAELKKRQEPYLNWAGKAEHTSFEVPTVSLHVHERIDPRSIIEGVKKRNGNLGIEQLGLFEQPSENPPLRDAIDFYKHAHNWSNRLIAGDSLLVMNSLLEKEGMGGQVQMVYIDPPYGITYKSNFQPFVNEREVKDGKDGDLTQEPEMVKAFRDTWELGIHSYLSYLRDRFLLSKALLHESGSCFLQISDENLHHIREVMDEVFGKECFCGIISFQKTGSLTGNLLGRTVDYLIWYCRDPSKVKYSPLFQERKKGDPSLDRYNQIEFSDGNERKLTAAEIRGEGGVPEGRRFRLQSLFSDGEPADGNFSYNFQNREYFCPPGNHWKTTKEGVKLLDISKRLGIEGNRIQYKRYLDDYPVIPINDRWESVQIGVGRKFVVETSPTVIQRCILMTTDPGDLILDPTCGSGTTAFVAEQWGRRWVTCDTSRVALALTKQRLMTSQFDYYDLAHVEEGVGSGFRFNTVPHVTLKSIANNPEIKGGMTKAQIYMAISKHADQETLFDQPLIDKKKIRVTGPFTVEAVPAPTVKPLDEAYSKAEPQPSDVSISRSGETVRQDDWRNELLKTGIRSRKSQRIEFSRVEPLPGTKWLHADGETKEDTPRRAVISFGPEHAPLGQKQVELAIEEAQHLIPKPSLIVFAAFQFDPEAAKDIDETQWPGVVLLKAQMNADLLTEDLKKKRASNESFFLIGQPEVFLNQVKKGEDKGKWQVQVDGFDYYNTRTGNIESGGPGNIAMWMLDTDYDGRSVFPRQVFFPMAGPKDGWSKLAKNLKAEIDMEKIEAFRGTVSLPFEKGENGRVAVKIIDDRGIESLKVIEIGE